MSDEKIVAVNPGDIELVVLRDEKFVSVAASGPPGPQGPIGPAGGDILVYDTNGVPSSIWVITTGLGRIAHVTIIGTDGEQRYAKVEQLPPYNVVTIFFNSPINGKALVG